MTISDVDKRLRGLYIITDPALLPGEMLIEGVRQALEGGASIVQYRDKLATDIERLRSAENLNDLCKEFSALFVVNDDLELCRRVNADGVHLGKTDGDIAYARSKLVENQILGVTCHSDFAYAHEAHQLGANYCAFGRLFPSRTKPTAPACDLSSLSILDNKAYASVAIGGIDIANAHSVLKHNIDMLAVIHGVFGQPDIRLAAEMFTQLIKESESVK